MDLVTVEFFIVRSGEVLLEAKLRKDVLFSGEGLYLCAMVARALSTINEEEVVGVRQI